MQFFFLVDDFSEVWVLKLCSSLLSESDPRPHFDHNLLGNFSALEKRDWLQRKEAFDAYQIKIDFTKKNASRLDSCHTIYSTETLWVSLNPNQQMKTDYRSISARSLFSLFHLISRVTALKCLAVFR